MSGKNPNDLSREWRLSFSKPPVAPIAAFLILLASMLSESLAQNSQPASSSALHEVVVTGRGTTDEEATKAAFVTALERTVGTIVHSSTVSRNFEIQSDVQLLLTNGCIESYDEINSSTAGGVVSKTIRARVRRGVVADWMRRAGWSGQGDLNDTWARLATSIRSRKQALDMLHEKVPGIRDALYKTHMLDLGGGGEIGGNVVPEPFTQENLDGEVLCVWAASFRPDFAFWEDHAAPLLAACFDVLCEKKARLFLNMNNAVPAPGLTRMPERRWQKIDPNSPPAWMNGKRIEAPPSAPHCIALERRTGHPECLDLSIYFFTTEVYERIMNPPAIHDAQGNLVARPERFGSLRHGLRAKLSFADGSEKAFSVVQASPLFQLMPIPWPGGVNATYCGPYLFPSAYADGWEEKSQWPEWHGPVRPERKLPGFAPFVIDRGRVLRGDGRLQQEFERAVDEQRAYRETFPSEWQTDNEAIVPLVFTLKLDELRRVRRLAVEPVTGAPPVEPGAGETLFKFLKSFLD